MSEWVWKLKPPALPITTDDGSQCPDCGSTDRQMLRGWCAEGPPFHAPHPHEWHTGEEWKGC